MNSSCNNTRVKSETTLKLNNNSSFILRYFKKKLMSKRKIVINLNISCNKS